MSLINKTENSESLHSISSNECKTPEVKRNQKQGALLCDVWHEHRPGYFGAGQNQRLEKC